MSNSDPNLSQNAKLSIEYTLEDGTRQRITYEPRTTNEGYWRITEHHVNGMWRIEGRESIQAYDVAFEALPPPTDNAENPQVDHHMQDNIIDADDSRSTAQPQQDDESD